MLFSLIRIIIFPFSITERERERERESMLKTLVIVAFSVFSFSLIYGKFGAEKDFLSI